ncbi:hypothetical protein [Rhizobium leguminosarum]|uniref:hypothetical protein n=1 Tax=Rhizobium leguminosarum TaxID=384 RepID=UPI001C9653AE|nr:hypothetical protein [Rhizobium leguminosarum]MBY5402515.1 hypothetical protein [Rhizobium leguminosarum]
MADLVKELISGVADSVLKEILKKTTGRATTKRRRRKTRPAATTTAARKPTSAKPKPLRKQVSKRRTAAGRSRQRRS